MKAVVTTIAEPTESLKKLAERLLNISSVIIVGDAKGPERFELPGTEFYSLEIQKRLPFESVKVIPENHYSRKNIGYLIAMQQGERSIYETDDDNAPNQFWNLREKNIKAIIANNAKWINVYRHFTGEHIWPRGFPLEKVNDPGTFPINNGILNDLVAPVQQGLADISPDVDAVWRLTLDREFYFERKENIALPAGTWCPFNTQNTWWWDEALPLLYLPVYCSFRMTDIWKSLIAQRCLWEMDYNVVFYPADVIQHRNMHNLMKDFEAEIPGYTLNTKIAGILSGTKLLSGQDNVLRNLIVCYETLISHSVFPDDENIPLKAWVKDVESLVYK